MLMVLFFLFSFGYFCMVSFLCHLEGIVLLFFFVSMLMSFSNIGEVFVGLTMDKFSGVLVFLVVWVFLVIYFMSFKYSCNYKKKYKMILWFLLLFLVLSFLSVDFLAFYVFFELSLIPLMFLIVGWGYQSERIQASFYLIMYTIFGSLPLLFVMFSFYLSGSLGWIFFLFLSAEDSLYFFFLECFILLSFFIKLPVFGLHLWLPKAHVEAPVSGSMILAAILLKFSAYGVYRFMWAMASSTAFFSWLVFILVFGSLLGSWVALSQEDMKSLIAYSSISHMGLMLVGVLFMSSMSNGGMMVILFAHGMCSSALFFLVGMFYEKSYSRQMLLQSGNLNLYFNMAFWWFLFLIMNFSAPPFLSLAGEVLVLFHSAAFNCVLVVFIMMISFFVAYFCMFMYSGVIHGKTYQQWFLAPLSDFFYLILFFHVFPNLLMMKLEIFLVCLHIF